MNLQDYIGNTPLVTLQHLGSPQRGNRVLVKLEGNNPAGSVKDRPALHMIARAEERGDIRPGDTLIEATSGNTGIALAMAAAIKGYRMILVMPENMSQERRAVMRAYGAELILVSREESMMGARDLAEDMARQGKGWLVDQFSNPDNPESHYIGTAPEIWQQSEERITHFISAMGTTGTIVGCSRYFKQMNPAIEVIGVHPAEGATIPGIRRWPEAYLPKIYDPSHIDRVLDVSQQEAEQTTRELAAREGIFCGISSGGAVAVALRLARQLENATLVAIIADRGDRYLSTGVFPAE